VEATDAAGNEDVTIVVISGVNHLFVRADDPGTDPVGWVEISHNLAAEVLDLIVSSPLERVDSNRPSREGGRFFFMKSNISSMPLSFSSSSRSISSIICIISSIHLDLTS